MEASAGRISLGPGAHVVHLVESTLSPSDYRRFGVAAMLERGCRVTVFDVSSIVYPGVAQDRSAPPAHERLAVHVLSDAAALADAFDTMADAAMVFCMVGSTYVARGNLPVFRSLARTRPPFLMISCNAQPHWGVGWQGRSGIGEWIRRVAQAKVADSVVARLPIGFLGVRACDFIVHGGRRSRIPNAFVGPGTRTINAHAMDYDLHLDAVARGAPRNCTAVFIDEYLPFHRDWEAMGIAPPISPETYRRLINRLFDRVERETGMRVAIAACPRGDYTDKPGYYGDREMIYDDTAGAVARCDLAIAHGSTAINHAIMCRKPVMLVMTREIYGSLAAFRSLYDALSNELATPLRFFDDPETTDLSGLLVFDPAAYDQFMENYIKLPQTPVRPFWSIVADAVEAVPSAKAG